MRDGMVSSLERWDVLRRLRKGVWIRAQGLIRSSSESEQSVIVKNQSASYRRGKGLWDSKLPVKTIPETTWRNVWSGQRWDPEKYEWAMELELPFGFIWRSDGPQTWWQFLPILFLPPLSFSIQGRKTDKQEIPFLLLFLVSCVSSNLLSVYKAVSKFRESPILWSFQW